MNDDERDVFEVGIAVLIGLLLLILFLSMRYPA